MPDALDPGRATRLLDRIRQGDASAADDLLPMLYAELREIAGYCMGQQPAGHTLQPTALVHEAWMRIARAQGEPQWESRAHFLRMAARTMRHVLVDHARAKRAAKRDAGGQQVPLDGVLASFERSSLDVLDLNAALDELARRDEELARIVELRTFGGLTAGEVARVLGVSERTVLRGWKVARLWLRDRMPDAGAGPGPG